MPTPVSVPADGLLLRPWTPAVVFGSQSVFSIDTDQQDAEVGFWVGPAHRRRGVAARGLRAATSYAIGVLELRRLVLYHGAENAGSCAVARANGYDLEGVHRRSYRYGDGQWHDEHSHARLRHQ